MAKQLFLSLIWCCHKLIPAVDTGELEKQLHLKFSMSLTGFKKRKNNSCHFKQASSPNCKDVSNETQENTVYF